MSPLETATPDGTSPNDSPSAAATGGNSATTPSASANTNNTENGSMIDSLGDALAGVNLGFHTSTPTGPAGTSTDWGTFSNPEASRNSFARNAMASQGVGSNDVRDETSAAAPGVVGASQPSMNPTTPDPLERKQSLDMFLSRSPSQVLGKDVFKLSSNNLPGLVIPEESQGAAAGTPAGAAPSPGTIGAPQDPQVQQQARRSSPSNTASTTSASRTSSPYETGTVSAGATGGGHTIQAFNAYDQQAKMQEGVNGAAPAYHPVTPASSAAPGPSYQDPGSATSNVTPRLQSPYGAAGQTGTPFGSAAPNQFDASSAAPQQQQMQQQQPQQQGQDMSDQQQHPQQQILYMAVPTPDGRGQVLQPVQIMQMPGKQQFAYVLPGPDGMPQAMPAMQGGVQPMMVMAPPMMPQQQGNVQPMMMQQQQQLQGGMMQGHGNDAMNSLMNNGGGNNNPSHLHKGMGGYSNDSNSNPMNSNLGSGSLQGQNGMGTDQYQTQPTDPALASLYATPQRPPLDTLLGQVRRLSRDQVGCRLVQQALDEEGPMAATLILNEGLPFWGEAMVDPFGNYLFQKILDKITIEERVMLIKTVSPRLVNASLNLHGTRSVQKIVELCSIDEERRNKEKSGDNAEA
ncbi:MAG: hypothetical protein SGARI_000501, partial [Bacillariaceae sp.]